MTLWHRFKLWRKRKRKRIERELREAAALFDECGEFDAARRTRDKAEEVRQGGYTDRRRREDLALLLGVDE